MWIVDGLDVDHIGVDELYVDQTAIPDMAQV